MRFQNRDGEILSTLYNNDGILTLRHLKDMFWPTASLRAVQKRLAKLVNNCYLARLTIYHRRTQPIPEPVFWLGWRGILWIAEHNNVTVAPPKNQGENQIRDLASQLRKEGLHWLREPRWHQLSHDLAVIEFQLNVERAIEQDNRLNLEMWQHETVFRSDWDVVNYRYADRPGIVKRMKRRMYPDSYFVIANRTSGDAASMTRTRFLLELDNATHTNSRFGREKVAPSIAYIRSRAYKARFGDNSGRWLIITTGVTRMKHLMQQTKQVAKAEAKVFLFTTFGKLKESNVLRSPVWHQGEQGKPVALFDRETEWGIW